MQRKNEDRVKLASALLIGIWIGSFIGLALGRSVSPSSEKLMNMAGVIDHLEAENQRLKAGK